MSAIHRNNVVAAILFAIAFSFVESSVVVYLRAIYYPSGFSFPLRLISADHLTLELIRECSTLIMLLVVGILVGGTKWQKFAFFLMTFGIWDIFYYVWLKLFLDWPASLTDWDVLFLFPMPWIGPVIAPLLLSILFIIASMMILKKETSVDGFHVSWPGWLLAAGGTVCILYSFMKDTDATQRFQNPQPYEYWLLVAGMVVYAFVLGYSFGIPFRKTRQ